MLLFSYFHIFLTKKSLTCHAARLRCFSGARFGPRDAVILLRYLNHHHDDVQNLPVPHWAVDSTRLPLFG